MSGKDGGRELRPMPVKVPWATPATAEGGRADWRFSGAGRLWDAELTAARIQSLAGKPQRYCDCICAEVLGELMECALDCGAVLSRTLIGQADELERYLSRWDAQGLLTWDREAGWLWLPTHMAAQSINGERLRVARQEALRLAEETELARRWLEQYGDPVTVGAAHGDNCAD